MPDPITIISVVVLLGVVIFVHELGHFLAARMFKVRVDVFSLGMGPRLFGVKRGDTDYRVSALPIGGYVKMAGESAVAEVTGAPDEFMSKPRWQRAIILVAGVTMNVILALVLMTGYYMAGGPREAFMDQPMRVAGVIKDSPADKAGIREGDVITAINGEPTPTWERGLTELVFSLPGKDVSLHIERDGQSQSAILPAAGLQPESFFGAYPEEPVIVGRVTAESPAEAAGLQSGDHLLEMNGEPLISPQQFSSKMQATGGEAFQLQARRGDQEFAAQLKPRWQDPDGRGVRWVIGIGFGSARETRSYAFAEAAERSFLFNARFSRQILYILGYLVQGKLSIKQLGGPIAIARESGQAARRGLRDFIQLTCIISLNLAVLNLLPIPILDGGHILMLAVEGLRRRDLSLAVKERFMQVGFLVLMLIFIVVMYNDIFNKAAR